MGGRPAQRCAAGELAGRSGPAKTEEEEGLQVRSRGAERELEGAQRGE